MQASFAVGQAPWSKGIVWTPPDEVRQAEHELRRMQQMGIEAVRTGLIRDERLLTVADTLGLQLFQELPIAFLSASALNDTLGYAVRQLDRALDRAREHPSARHFGLARLADTSVPAACSYFERFARHVRQRGEETVRLYYLTPFVASDRCGAAVDFVLLDVQNAEAPLHLLSQWTQTHPAVPVGLGALGTWVRPGAPRGLRVAHSPEAQARYLERQLSALEAAPGTSPTAVFVYRWADGTADPYGRPYGLHARTGTRRPAADVVEGFFTEQQTVFAFPAGEPPPPAVPWLILLGWGVVILIGSVYAREPRFRHTVVRYFQAHTFYQEAVREGREVLVGSSLALLIAEAISIGALGTVGARLERYERGVVLALQALPEGLQEGLASLLATPWMLGLLIGAVYALGLVLWALVLVSISKRASSISAEQAAMLVVWPRWPVFGVLVGALVIATLSPEAGRPLMLLLIGGTVLIAVQAVGRTLIDFMAVARLSGYWAALAAVGSPLPVLVLLVLVEVIRNDVALRFLWHLLVRT